MHETTLIGLSSVMMRMKVEYYGSNHIVACRSFPLNSTTTPNVLRRRP